MKIFVTLFALATVAAARLSDEKCEEYSEYTYNFIRKDEILHDFTHMGLLGYIDNGEISYSCSATLISESYALTSAYCVEPLDFRKEPDHIRFGLPNANDKPPYYKFYKIVESLVHPQYSIDTGKNCLALIKISPPISPYDNIIPGCLYTKNITDDQPLVDLVWANKVDDFGATFLLTVDSSIIPVSTCHQQLSELYKEFVFDEEFVIDESFICANRSYPPMYMNGHGGTSHVFDSEKPKIAGINIYSTYPYGNESSSIETLEVSTRLFHYLDWIEWNVWGRYE